MKKFRSLIALLLAAVMLLCFAGCSAKEIFPNAEPVAEETDNDKAVGTWVCAMDMTEMMNNELTAQFAQMGFNDLELPEEKLNVYIAFDFEDDKTFVLYVDEDKTIDSMKVYIDSMMDSLVEWMYAMFEDMGITREQADAAIQSQYGMGIEEYLDSQMAAAMDPEVLAEGFADIENLEGCYNFDDGKLYIADTEEELAETEEYATYTLDGDTLTIDEGNTNDAFAEFASLGIKLPLVFERD